MSEDINNNIVETDNLNFMAYFKMNGLKCIGARVECFHNKEKVILLFNDPEEKATNLEFQWYESESRQFQDLRSFFRNEIDKQLRGYRDGK